MNKFIALTRIQLKDFIGRYSEGLGVKNKKLASILILFLVALIIIPNINLSFLIYRVLARIGQGHLLITNSYINSILLNFFFGIPFIVSVFFFSRDARFLAALPVREDSLVLAKLVAVYLYLLFLSFLLMFPGLAVYLYNTGMGVYTVIMAVLVLLLTPLLPMFIVTILILPFANIFSNSRHKRTLILIFNFLMIFAIIGIQLFTGNLVENPARMEEVLVSGSFLVLIGRGFPPGIWVTRIFLGSYRDLFLFLALNILLFFILKGLAGIFFRKALLSFSEDRGNSRGEIYYKEKSLAYHLLRRNILIIIREPMFFLNTVLSMLAPLLVVIIMLFTGELSLDLLQSPRLEPYLLLIVSIIMISPAVTGNISATAITREGKAFWETRVLPIKAVDNIRYRILTTIIFCLTGSLILLLITLVVLPLTLKMIIIAATFCLTVTLFLATIDILIDIYRPILNWTNPTAAVKNNLNVTFSLLIRGVIALIIYLLYKIWPGIFANIQWLMVLGSIIFLLLYLLLRPYLYTNGVKRFNRITI